MTVITVITWYELMYCALYVWAIFPAIFRPITESTPESSFQCWNILTLTRFWIIRANNSLVIVFMSQLSRLHRCTYLNGHLFFCIFLWCFTFENDIKLLRIIIIKNIINCILTHMDVSKICFNKSRTMPLLNPQANM
jgi:hypothetical protein